MLSNSLSDQHLVFVHCFRSTNQFYRIFIISRSESNPPQKNIHSNCSEYKMLRQDIKQMEKIDFILIQNKSQDVAVSDAA